MEKCHKLKMLQLVKGTGLKITNKFVVTN